MTMFDRDHVSTWNNDNNEKSTLKICVHCSIPFAPNDNFQNFVMANFPSTSSASSSSSRWLVKALFSIFKLSYLNCFDNYKEDHVHEEDLWMCQNCDDRLVNLCQIYNDFLQIGKIDSYLSKKLNRLDEIIANEGLTNCVTSNLTAAATTSTSTETEPVLNIFDDYETTNEQQQYDSGDEDFDIPVRKLNNCDTPPSTTTTPKAPIPKILPELRILLTRLPQKYLSSVSTLHKKINVEREKDFNYDPPASLLSLDNNDDDDDQLPPAGKSSLVDDEDNFEPPDSDSSEGYNPEKEFKNVKKKKVAKSKTISFEKERRNRRWEQTRQEKVKVPKSDVFQEKSRKVGRKKNESSSSSMKKKNVANKSNAIPKRTKNINKNGKYREDAYLGKKAKYPNPCWYCDLTDFATPTDVQEHTREVHLPQNNYMFALICQRCARICNTDKILEKHLEKCLLIPCGDILPKKFSCTQCSKKFVTKCRLHAHQVHHNRDRPFACDQCDYKAKLAGSLERHKVSHHTGTSVKCGECGKQFKNELVLRGHTYNMHHKEGHEKYLQHQKVIRHRQKTKDVMTTVCVDCNGVDFFHRVAYLNHRKSVHGEVMGKHTCHICGKNFARAHTLKTHTYTHSEDRPYLCNMCGKSYKDPSKLKAHEEQTHSEEGRLRYNERIREYNRRKKLIAAQFAHVSSEDGGRQVSAAATNLTTNLEGSTGGQLSSTYHQNSVIDPSSLFNFFHN